MIQGVRAVRANDDHRLIDGIQSAAEVEVQFRQSEQLPTPRYRLGQTVYLLAAIDGLMDPQWRPLFSEPMLKKLDKVGQRLIDESRQAIEEPLPDLTRDDGAGEYPDLPVPQPAETGGAA